MNPQTPAFFNGDYLPLSDIHLSPLDRGFLFGDSIYEVAPVYNQIELGGTAHYQRLVKGLSAIGIESPYSAEQWAETLRPLFSADNPAEMLYIQVTRGVEAMRKHRFPVNVPPTVLAFMIPFTPPVTERYAGCHGHFVDDLRWQRCDIKSTSLLGNILAYHELYQKGAENDEALLVRDDHVVEAPSSNVFAVVDGVIITPPLENILVGVTRGMVIEDAKRLGLPIIEAPLSVANVKRASEVWVTNSYEEVKPITSVNGQAIGDGKSGDIWLQLYRAYQQRKA